VNEYSNENIAKSNQYQFKNSIFKRKIEHSGRWTYSDSSLPGISKLICLVSYDLKYSGKPYKQ